ncbi:PaaI family thioesterase [Neisseriaceae bacterium ESL0693]|nr:PaaI family thioesterase [Neisseriaceae bacterium ESL0693]
MSNASLNFQPDTAQTQKANHLMPYSFAIGLQIGTDQQNRYLFRLPFQEQNIGNPFLPALHGGLMGGFLQSCMILYLHHHAPEISQPQLIDFSIDYLRSGHALDCYAQCQLIRQGSRIINIQASMWQDNELKPIATARAHLNIMP